MNKNRFYIGLLVTAILAVLVYASYGMVNAGKKETYHSVAVIVDDSSSDRWTAFKEGLEQGRTRKISISTWCPPAPL